MITINYTIGRSNGKGGGGSGFIGLYGSGGRIELGHRNQTRTLYIYLGIAGSCSGSRRKVNVNFENTCKILEGEVRICSIICTACKQSLDFGRLTKRPVAGKEVQPLDKTIAVIAEPIARDGSIVPHALVIYEVSAEIDRQFGRIDIINISGIAAYVEFGCLVGMCSCGK